MRRLRAHPRLGCLGLSVVLSLAIGSAASAAAAQAPGLGAVQLGDGGALLQRVQHAGISSSYQGTLSYNAAGVVSNSRVLHFSDGRQTYERLELLDGESRLQYRHNDQVVTLWPANRVAMLEQRDPLAQFPALPAAAGTRGIESYDVQKVGQERVAGLEADVLLLKPRDKLRFSQRLWTHRDTGLMLRNDVIGPTGEVLESSAFVDVHIGAKAQPESFLRPMRQLDGFKVLRPKVDSAQLEAEGWVLGKAVPGFQLVSCSHRPLDATSDGTAPLQVIQSVFSDGLAQVSVFVERYDAQRHPKATRSSVGASQTVMARRGDWWITVVGEVPMATAQQFEVLFERKR